MEINVQLPPGVYRHYKGALYLLFQTVTHSETREVLACYRCLYGDFSWWVRPLAMFCENVILDGIARPRFALIAAVDPATLTLALSDDLAQLQHWLENMPLAQE